MIHTPVLLQEAIEGLKPHKGGVYIDATAGEGGHIREIAKTAKSVLGIDVSNEQITRLKEAGLGPNIEVERANFARIAEVAARHGMSQVDGVLFDLGLSYWELAHLEKGFSYKRQDDTLDMRLDQESGESAADVLNTKSEDELYDIFSGNSEEVKSRELAQAIVRDRVISKFKTVSDLTRCIEAVAGKTGSRMYARIFQALRMHVNNEKENLKQGLAGADSILKMGGRLVVISFHSLEDRIVKVFMKSHGYALETKRVGQHDDLRFERSATLRVGVKKI